MNRKADIISQLQEGGRQTERFFRSLDPAALHTPVYTDELTWNVRQVLAHFITIEQSMQWLFRNILAGGPGSPEDFDLMRYNREQPPKLDNLSLDELLSRFRSVRRETIDIVESMDESDLDRTGRHPYHGIDRLEVFIRWAAEHARRHENDVRRALPGSSQPFSD